MINNAYGVVQTSLILGFFVILTRILQKEKDGNFFPSFVRTKVRC